MDVLRIQRGAPGYPPDLDRLLGREAPCALSVLGEPRLLETSPLALFCSIRCPGRLILRTYDLACALRTAGITVASGFHAPMEKECLPVLLRGTQPVIYCPARSLEGMRLRADLRKPLADGRLLIVSAFSGCHRRATAELALARNRFLAALAGRVLVAHAAPGSRTEALCREVVSWGRPLFTLQDADNAHLIALGARPAPVREIAGVLLGSPQPGSAGE